MAYGSEAKRKNMPPAPVKKEEPFDDSDSDSEDDVPIARITKAKAKKEEIKEEDNVPIALSGNAKRQQQKKQAGADPNSVSKEKRGGKMFKKEELKSNAKSSQLTKKNPKFSDDGEEEDNPKSKEKTKKTMIVKKDEEKKMGVKASNGVSKENGKDKKGKKVYNFAGQKHDPPEERDPLRIFYETLYNQIPKSEMAAIWMMEWGLLPREEEAKKVYEKKLKKAQQQKLGTAVKAASANKATAIGVKNGTTVSKAVTKTLKKRKADDSEGDDFMTRKMGAKKQKISC